MDQATPMALTLAVKPRVVRASYFLGHRLPGAHRRSRLVSQSPIRHLSIELSVIILLAPGVEQFMLASGGTLNGDVARWLTRSVHR